MISCLEKYYRFFGDDDLRDRLISIFTRSTPDGRRRCFGDNAAGLGASHQTGWTALIADVIRRRHGAVRETVDLVGDLIHPLGEQQR